MGFFSWKCAVSGESIAAVQAGRHQEDSQAVLVTPDANYFEFAYEGNGVFNGVDVYEWVGARALKKTIDVFPMEYANLFMNNDYQQAYEEKRKKGIDLSLQKKPERTPIKIVKMKHFDWQTYDELPESEVCPNQGYFYSGNGD